MDDALDPRALAAAKVAGRARRLRSIKRRGAAFAAAILCACWLAVGGQLAAGDDPALAAKATKTTKSAKTTTSAKKTKSAKTTTPEHSSTRSTDQTVAEPTPVTTSQS